MSDVVTLVPKAGSELVELRRKVTSLESEVVRMRDLLDRRPALNNGLAMAYQRWTTLVYTSDFFAANGRLPTSEDL